MSTDEVASEENGLADSADAVDASGAGAGADSANTGAGDALEETAADVGSTTVVEMLVDRLMVEVVYGDPVSST